MGHEGACADSALAFNEQVHRRIATNNWSKSDQPYVEKYV